MCVKSTRSRSKAKGNDMKKIFLTALILLSLHGAVLAQSYTNTDGIVYTTTNGAVTITGYVGAGGTVTISNSISGLPVTSIGNNAFYQCLRLTNVTVSASVTSIGDRAFYYCWSLTNVTIPNSITNIGDWAFFNCYRLTNITIPNNLTGIGLATFAECTGLLNITIPNSVTSIGQSAFFDCYSVTNVTIPNSVTSIGSTAFDTCAGLISLTIPNSVTNIGDHAFYRCFGLTNVTIGTGLNNIDGQAFFNCTNLSGVHFLGNAPSIGVNVFYNDTHATVYYLPGTTGWDNFSQSAGVTTAQWFLPEPIILSWLPTFGVQSNSFGFTISWATNGSVIVEACTNLTKTGWFPLGTNSLSNGSVYFRDSNQKMFSSRFYRIRSP